MSSLRIELVGAKNHNARIQVKSERGSVEHFGTEFETDVGFDETTVTVDFKQPSELSEVPAEVWIPPIQQVFAHRAAQNGLPGMLRFARSSAGPQRHPRFFHIVEVGVKDGRGSSVRCRVDCRFLPMTSVARAVDQNLLGQLDPKLRDALLPSGMEVRLYECTVGFPRYWVVAFAPGNMPPRTQNLHAFVFLMPKSQLHQNLKQLSLFSARRYLLSAPKDQPFFIRCEQPDKPVEVADWFTTNPNAAFLEQVLNSQKPVFVALPVPSGDAKVPTGANLRELMLALRRALHADEVDQQVDELPPNFRVALGGFSRGADTAAELLAQQPQAVDEFYWFDPGLNGLNMSGDVQNWAQGNSTRRLRLIGTTVNQRLHQLAKQLSGLGSRVLAMPEPNFRRSEIYKSAVAVPVHSTQLKFPETFQSASDPAAPPPGSLSAATSLFLVSDNGSATEPQVLLARRPPPSGGKPIHVFLTAEEIAGKLRFGALNNRSRRVAQEGMAHFIQGPGSIEIYEKEHAGDGCVHQWSVVGGFRNGSASASRVGFRGFLHTCLEGADFPEGV